MGQDFEIHLCWDEERRFFVKIDEDEQKYYAQHNEDGEPISPFEIVYEHRAMKLTLTLDDILINGVNFKELTHIKLRDVFT